MSAEKLILVTMRQLIALMSSEAAFLMRKCQLIALMSAELGSFGEDVRKCDLRPKSWTQTEGK